MEPRTEGAIAVLPTGNLQGSVKFFLLGSGRVVTRDQWVPLPMPPPVIDYLNGLAVKNPVSADPIFSVNGTVVSDTDDDGGGCDPDPPPLLDWPVRVVPASAALVEPTFDPPAAPITTSVISADENGGLGPVAEKAVEAGEPTPQSEPNEVSPADDPTPTEGVVAAPVSDSGVQSVGHALLDPGVTEALRAPPTHSYNTRRGPARDYRSMPAHIY